MRFFKSKAHLIYQIKPVCTSKQLHKNQAHKCFFFLQNFNSSNFFCHGSGAQTVEKFVYLTKKKAQLQKRLSQPVFIYIFAENIFDTP